MLNSKQKVLKKIFDRYIDELSEAVKHFDLKNRHAIIARADENKRLATLAVNIIM